MPTNAFTSQGSTISINGTLIGEVTDFDGPNTTRGEIDATTLSSTAREYRAALQDRGAFSFNVNLDPSNEGQRKLWAGLSDADPQDFVLTLPDADTTTLSFSALVQNFQITGQVDSIVKAAMQLRITGDVTGFPAPS